MWKETTPIARVQMSSPSPNEPEVYRVVTLNDRTWRIPALRPGLVAAPKFYPGEHIHAWWGTWMDELRAYGLYHHHEDARWEPKWYPFQVMAYDGWGTMRYGGVEHTCHCYLIAWPAGPSQRVPESCLRRVATEEPIIPPDMVPPPLWWPHPKYDSDAHRRRPSRQQSYNEDEDEFDVDMF